MLTVEEELALSKRWRDYKDVEAAHKLVTSHLRLVVKIALGYRGYGLPVGELISEGNVGMMQAMNRFDPDRGFRLATYAILGGRVEMRSSDPAVPVSTLSSRRPLNVIPAGVPVRRVSATIRFVRYLVLRFDLAELVGLHGGPDMVLGGLRLHLMFASPKLLRICELLAVACTTQGAAVCSTTTVCRWRCWLACLRLMKGSKRLLDAPAWRLGSFARPCSSWKKTSMANSRCRSSPTG
jgi:hypothetical protein